MCSVKKLVTLKIITKEGREKGKEERKRIEGYNDELSIKGTINPSAPAWGRLN